MDAPGSSKVLLFPGNEGSLTASREILLKDTAVTGYDTNLQAPQEPNEQ
jgi:hypothetical protein